MDVYQAVRTTPDVVDRGGRPNSSEYHSGDQGGALRAPRAGATLSHHWLTSSWHRRVLGGVRQSLTGHAGQLVCSATGSRGLLALAGFFYNFLPDKHAGRLSAPPVARFTLVCCWSRPTSLDWARNARKAKIAVTIAPTARIPVKTDVSCVATWSDMAETCWIA